MACRTCRDVWTPTSDLSRATYAIEVEAERLCAGMREDQLSWRPQVRCWSIAENLAHLRITTEVFLPAVDAAIIIAKEKKLQCTGPLSLSLLSRLAISRLEPGVRMKLRAPEALQPRSPRAPSVELELFLASQGAIRQRIADVDGLDLTAFRFSSPVTRYVRLNLLEFFLATNAHARRHLQQANAVRQSVLFQQQ
jgi:hypothetical protein